MGQYQYGPFVVDKGYTPCDSIIWYSSLSLSTLVHQCGRTSMRWSIVHLFTGQQLPSLGSKKSLLQHYVRHLHDNILYAYIVCLHCIYICLVLILLLSSLTRRGSFSAKTMDSQWIHSPTVGKERMEYMLQALQGGDYWDLLLTQRELRRTLHFSGISRQSIYHWSYRNKHWLVSNP